MDFDNLKALGVLPNIHGITPRATELNVYAAPDVKTLKLLFWLIP
ncbi:MAG: hypothetical protein WCP25_08915 [Polynucleobacter sp.]